MILRELCSGFLNFSFNGSYSHVVSGRTLIGETGKPEAVLIERGQSVLIGTSVSHLLAHASPCNPKDWRKKKKKKALKTLRLKSTARTREKPRQAMLSHLGSIRGQV